MRDQVLCPVCGAKMVLRETKKFTYGNGQPRKFYGCSMFPDCRSVHGAHPDGTPLGRPGTPEEKKARVAAHDAFDPLWKSGRMKRGAAYKWLSEQLGVAQVHIGECDVATCQRIVELCSASQPPRP